MRKIRSAIASRAGESVVSRRRNPRFSKHQHLRLKVTISYVSFSHLCGELDSCSPPPVLKP